MPGLIQEKNSLKSKINVKTVKNIATGTFIGVLITAVLAAAVSAIMYATKTDFALYYYLFYAFVFLGALFNARFLYRRIDGRGFAIGLLSSLPYIAVILVIFLSVLQFKVSVNIVFVALVALAGGTVGGITAANSRKR